MESFVTVQAFDENGVEFSLDDFDETLEKRWVPAAVLAFRVAWYIGRLIPKASRIGKALLRVAKCIGWEDMWNCRGDVSENPQNIISNSPLSSQ